MTAIAFELGISLGEISKVQVERIDAPKLEDALTWFVRYDDGVVTIHALVAGRMREIARASWVRELLIERTSSKPGVPSDREWKLVATALSRVMRRAYSTAPKWRHVFDRIEPASRKILLGSIIMGAITIGVVALIFVVRTDEPARETIAPFDALTWSDVQHGGETTPPLILKDPARERGRKLCVAATVDAIEATTVDARKVHTGTLRTAGGDALPFIALGSTRSITARAASRFCGVAHGKQIVGLFDLPENRRDP